MPVKYYITGDIVGADAPNYGEKRVEIGGGDTGYSKVVLMVAEEQTLTPSNGEEA